MSWVLRRQRSSRVLAWCFAALFVLAQFHLNAHYHEQDNDWLSADCSICAVASHFFSLPGAEPDTAVVAPSGIVVAPDPDYRFAPVFSARIKTRAPPASAL